jgi:hypothetical protein
MGEALRAKIIFSPLNVCRIHTITYLVTRYGVWIGIIGFTGVLKAAATINYSAIANSLTLQFTTASTKSQFAVSSPVAAW